MTVLDFRDADIPSDESPVSTMPEGATSFDPEFPGSTEEAPFGYKADGTPYKRRPNSGAGRPKGTTGKAGKVNESTARAAASLLAQLNNMIGLSLSVFGMPLTAAAIVEANSQFEDLAIEALKTDPKLCKKIMSVGSTSGKTMLIVAYANLGMSAFPSARSEIAAKREAAQDE